MNLVNSNTTHIFIWEFNLWNEGLFKFFSSFVSPCIFSSIKFMTQQIFSIIITCQFSLQNNAHHSLYVYSFQLFYFVTLKKNFLTSSFYIFTYISLYNLTDHFISLWLDIFMIRNIINSIHQIWGKNDADDVIVISRNSLTISIIILFFRQFMYRHELRTCQINTVAK